ncbi:TraC family protein [Campylobacter sp. RM12651]|uniref:TraC family protein n=1 Tax=Campylobacter sp. RM12651 TaxID=1660079 RepID=UPI001EFA9F5D|nr:TraC family protein [Campylobacter sp. RM12651]ULO03831.1 F-type type IV conjugative transfer system, ATPase TraC [Campylobacter sp. RM12651]
MHKEYTSLPTHEFNKIYKRYKFSDFLNYSFYDFENNIYYNNDDTFGVILECSTRIKASIKTSQTIENIIKILPNDMFLQVSMLGLKNIKDTIDFWQQEHKRRSNNSVGLNSELCNNTIESMAKFYYRKTKEPICMNMPTTFKKNVLLFSIKSKSLDKIMEFKENIYNSLLSDSFHPTFLEPQKLKTYIYELLNPNAIYDSDGTLKHTPKYNKEQLINKQLINTTTEIKIHDEYLNIDNKNIITLTPISYPSEAFLSDFGEKLGNTIGSSINNNQFRDNFLITANITKLPEGRTKAAKRNHTMILSQKAFPIFRKFLKVREESEGILERIDNNNETLYAFDLNVCVYGNDLKSTKESVEIVKKMWNSGDSKIVLSECNSIHQLVFLNSLPLNVNEEYMFDLADKYFSFFPNQITQFLPLESDWSGGNPNLIFTSRRGNIVGIDLFKDSETSYNGYIVASSGGGKSVLLNNLVFNTYCKGDRVFILDYDNSFRRIVEILGGQYINLSLENPISFNPFSDIQTLKDLIDEEEYLSSFIYALGCSNNKEEAEKEEKYIKSKIIESVRALYNSLGSNLEITNIRDKLKSTNEPKLIYFAESLRNYCKGGVYEKFFSGRCQFNVEKELIAVEFKGVEDQTDLRDSLIMLLTYHMKQMMYNNDDRKNNIQIIFDEAHRFLGKNPRMDDFIDNAYRRARKYGASIIIATQSFGDICNSKGEVSRAGETIISNSPWKFFMRQNEESVALLVESNKFALSNHEVQLLRDVKMYKDNYSEFVLINPEGFKFALRLVMDRYFYYVTTTNMNDKVRLKTIADIFNVNTHESINLLIQYEKDIDNYVKNGFTIIEAVEKVYKNAI